MTPVHVILPWPPAILSPNARTHWAARARAVKAYREACAWQVVDQTTLAQRSAFMGADRLRVHLTFIPPDRRLRDADNCLAAAKAGLDGLADALQINDRRFILSSELVTTGEIGGMVRVAIGFYDVQHGINNENHVSPAEAATHQEGYGPQTRQRHDDAGARVP